MKKINKNDECTTTLLIIFMSIKWQEISLTKDNKNHKQYLWPHNNNCIVTSLSNDIIRKQNIDLPMWWGESDFSVCAQLKKRKTLSWLYFSNKLHQIWKNSSVPQEESAHQIWAQLMLSFLSYKGKTVHRQTDRKTDRQKQTDHNNPLLSSSVNYCPACREANKGDDPSVTLEKPCEICFVRRATPQD